MPKHEGAEHHKMAAEHHEKAAHHHKEAAKHHEEGHHERAGITPTLLTDIISMRGTIQRKPQNIIRSSMAKRNSDV
jgi:hypothetical protein